ncbi:MAG: hypothetical protein JOZ02_10800 [Acidobacteria bacterium]|nr:hypothetical protein [Acidobacteriota bacterium]
MGRLKRTSKILDKASARLAGLKDIGTQDFGNGMTSEGFEDAVADTRQKLADYNQALSAVDEKGNLLDDSEKYLKDFAERVLAGVAAKYGKNSNEYEKAGGVRKSERKRPAARKPAPKPST